MILDHTIAQGRAGNRAGNLLIFPNALPFVGQEKEQSIPNNGSAKRRSEGVSQEQRRRVRFALLQLRELIKKVVGHQICRAVVFIGRAVKLVGAALGLQRDLSAGGAALIRAGIAGGHAEFFDGVQRGAQCATKGITVQLIVVIHAIERDVGLVAACAIDGAAATVEIFVSFLHVWIGNSDDTWLQTQ